MKPERDYRSAYSQGKMTGGSNPPRKPPTAKRVGKERMSSKRRPLFLNEPRSAREIVSDVIRADCMNHGYRLEKSIGEGAYAKVKLAEVMPAKLARNQTLADIAEETGNLQVAIKVIDNKHVPKEFLKKFLPRELANHVPLEPHRNVIQQVEKVQRTAARWTCRRWRYRSSVGDMLNELDWSTLEARREQSSLTFFYKIHSAAEGAIDNVAKFTPLASVRDYVPLLQALVRVLEQFHTTERVYVVMEYCCKGDLLDLINQSISESHRGLGESKSRDMFKQMCEGVQHIHNNGIVHRGLGEGKPRDMFKQMCEGVEHIHNNGIVHRGLGESKSRDMFKQMCEGVQHIHNNGIVHRDLKCENILICEDYTIKVTDFGFSTKYDDKESFLRTSCGSYAYTAPEVIKSKPYNGFKSDTWSLGVILFAMLNGRLPFNDSQLVEMEEDMKMQRLRFERTVSFDAMVLVRRILQYNAAQRPSIQDILNDPWMTGKKMIPRQTNRPKWINPYEAKPEEKDLKDEAVVGSNPVYYKAVVPERGHDATVTVKHEGNETVMLKSRVGPKKNIWTSGPAIACPGRPNTWPKSEKTTEQPPKRNQTRQTRGPSRPYGRNASANMTLIDKRPQKGNQKDNVKGNHTRARGSDTTVHLSKNFMEKYMKKTKNDERTYKGAERKTSNCELCMEAGSCEKMSTVKKQAAKTTTTTTQPSKHSRNETKIQFQEDCQTNEDDPDKLLVDFGMFYDDAKLDNDDVSIHDFELGTKQESDIAASNNAKGKSKCQQKGQENACNRSCSPEFRRKVVTMSAYTRGRSNRKPNKTADPTASRSLDLSNKGLFNYMVSRSTNPAERVKYFRERIMNLYGNSVSFADNRAGLPPLMVQALRPPSAIEGSQPSARVSSSAGGRAWSSSTRGRAESGRRKPIQRVVVHSAM